MNIPPYWLSGSLTLVWAQAQFLPVLTGSVGAGRGIGVMLGLGGFALAIWAAVAFRTHMTSVVPHLVPRALITSGPFRFSRNPIYLGVQSRHLVDRI